MPLKIADVEITDVQEHKVQDVNLEQGEGVPPFIDVLKQVTLLMVLPAEARFHGQKEEDGKPLHLVYQEKLAKKLDQVYGPGALTVSRGTDPCRIFATWTLAERTT